MSPETLRLPNGQTLTVVPVFGGLQFKSNDLNLHQGIFPPGWTIALTTDHGLHDQKTSSTTDVAHSSIDRSSHTRQFRNPTLQNDSLFISSISQPSDAEFKPATSPTRMIAMMLWATLYWYFHQAEPSPHLDTEASKNTPDLAKPKGDWKVNIRREGVFRGKALLHKLERMGLIASQDSSVGSSTDPDTAEGWSDMFASRRSFWQMSGKLFLFTLSPAITGTTGIGSPHSSRASSPSRHIDNLHIHSSVEHSATTPGSSAWVPSTPGPFSSGSHLPTYYPPPPPQYTTTDGVRHPVRPKPPRQGETFYLRFVPSVGQYLSFRVASLHDRPVAYTGPRGESKLAAEHESPHMPSIEERSNSKVSDAEDTTETKTLSDVQLLHKWMNNDRVAKFWGCKGPVEVQHKFLKGNLESRHSFPVIGCWDGKPFGYFEVYWVKEDILGKHLSPSEVDIYDRGIHVLVGEQEFRGKHRLQCWMSALTHWAFIADYRTNNVVLEPRIDNERYADLLMHHAAKKLC